MLQVRLHPQSHIDSLLEDVVDYDNNITYRGTDCIVFEDDLRQADDSIYPIKYIKKNADTYTTEIVTIAPSDGFAIHIHEKWIKSVIVDGTEYDLVYSKPWFDADNIKTTTVHTFFNIPSLSILFNDACCTSCGAELETPTDDMLCDSCVNTITNLNSYSHKPAPVFFGEDSTKHYGIELEYGFTNKREAAKIMSRHTSALYLKSDSSVRGGDFNAELVSHPHTFAELMKPDSFIHTVATAKVNPSESNGCHIHISRTSFTDNKHYALFYFLLHSSRDLLEYVGGRQLNSYCKFQSSGRIHSKMNQPESADRARAINENNTATVEVRIFNSTNKPADIRRYIQFVDSAIEYTRGANKRISVKDYFSFVKANNTIYSDLASHIVDFKSTLPAPITYREPIIKDMAISKIALTDLPNVISFLVDSDEYQLDTSNSNVTLSSDGQIHFYARRGSASSRDSYNFPLTAIRNARVCL